MLITVGLSGCNENSSDGGEKKSSYTGENEIVEVNATLNNLSLKVDDLSGDFVKTQEEYITKHFFDENPNSPLNGELILEKYNATFIESNFSVVIETLYKLFSNDIAKNVMDKIESFIESDFPEQSIETIGDKSYFGKTTIVISGTNVDHYVLAFSRGNILVFLDGYVPLQDTFIGYGKIIDYHIRHTVAI